MKVSRFSGNVRKTGYDHCIARGYEVCGSSVNVDLFVSGLPVDNIGLKTRTLCDVPYMNCLMGEEACQLKEVARYGDAPLVVEIRLGHRSTM